MSLLGVLTLSQRQGICNALPPTVLICASYTCIHQVVTVTKVSCGNNTNFVCASSSNACSFYFRAATWPGDSVGVSLSLDLSVQVLVCAGLLVGFSAAAAAALQAAATTAAAAALDANFSNVAVGFAAAGAAAAACVGMVAVALLFVVAGMGIMLNSERMLSKADKEHLIALDNFNHR